MAISTWDGSTAPVEQADPLEAATPGEVEVHQQRLAVGARRPRRSARAARARRPRRSPPGRERRPGAAPRGRRAARRSRGASAACSAAASAAARPSATAPATFSVPGRMPYCWPPPWMMASTAFRSRTIERADALGGADLVAGDREQGARQRRAGDRESCRTPGPRRCEDARRPRRHRSAISAIGWTTPISLLTHMTETTAGRSASAASSAVEVEPALGVHRQDDLPAAEVAHRVGGGEDRLVLDGGDDRAHGAARGPAPRAPPRRCPGCPPRCPRR